jgi:hypothetical protein
MKKTWRKNLPKTVHFTMWSTNLYGRRHTDILQLKKFRGFFKCLQRQYIGANWFAVPIYWRCTRRTKLFAAPRLFGQTMPIQSAGVSGSGNRFSSSFIIPHAARHH